MSRPEIGRGVGTTAVEMAWIWLGCLLVLSWADTAPQPEAVLVQPIPRNKTDAHIVGKSPCGGAPKGPSHYLAEPGSLNPVAWSVRTPSLLGNCTLTLGRTEASGYTVLFPLDVQTDNFGKFPCGRTQTYMERVSIEYPTGFTCDGCVLQWAWETEVGMFYQCVDLEIFAGVRSSCFGKCHNGGVCVNDQCECVVGFIGLYCEKEDIAASQQSVFWLFLLSLLILLILLIVALVTYIYVNNFRLSRSSYLFFRRYQPWCLRNPKLDYWEQSTGNLNSPNQRQPAEAQPV